MRYANRLEAGRRLGEILRELGFGAGSAPSIVLGVPRGGVVVAAAVAEVLGLPLEVAVAGKVGAPGNPELAIGAVAEGGTVLYDEALVRKLKVSRGYLEEETARLKEKIAVMAQELRNGTAPCLAGRETVLVDDGVATGLTIEAMARDIVGQGALNVCLAVPVGPAETIERLRRVADLVVCPLIPAVFEAVGSFYADFRQVETAQVQAILARGVAGGRESG